MNQQLGAPYPLGATWDGRGVNFALFSEHATGVDLCLFDSIDAQHESQNIHIAEQSNHVWHCYLTNVLPGQLYGYRVWGPYDPHSGYRFNPHKVLVDPYAKAIGRDLKWADEVFGYKIGTPDADLSFDDRDSAPFAPLAQVIDPAFTLGNDRAPRTPWHESIIYELHVKGQSFLNPLIPQPLRGTYAGLASDTMINHFIDLGITAIELQPVQYFLDDRYLVNRGQTNYWGYNTLCYFAPATRYAATNIRQDPVHQFKTMVAALHNAGIEVILDVVYNHTAEGNQMGPSLSMRGIDNSNYYKLSSEDARYYMDYSGTGNSLNMSDPRVLQLIMDSLRYWVTEMHVDGFRFDLASTLARELYEVNRLSAFFDIIHQDPVLCQIKLVAEPWDVGPGGYQMGNFPVLWSEWNGVYRDHVRRFWKADTGIMPQFATRLCGSSDLFKNNGRTPSSSINFITSHDGFTLQDLASFNNKHNEKNGDNNQDGSNENYSWNCGAEGPTDDSPINELREQQKRNLITTLLVSAGVPMLLSGDELGRSQQGNNNAYCHDNEITWLNWNLTNHQENFLQFVKRIIDVRKKYRVFQKRKFFQGSNNGSKISDVFWFKRSGAEFNDEEWKEAGEPCIGVLLSGSGHKNDHEGAVSGNSVLLLFNAHFQPIEFTLPVDNSGSGWSRILDTADPLDPPIHCKPGESYQLQARSIVVLHSSA